jgi:hypothetical protein
MDAAAIYRVLKDGTLADRRALVSALPPEPMRDLAMSTLDSDKPVMLIAPLAFAAMRYCNGAAPEVGAELAKALHRLAVELFTQTTNHGLLPTTLSGLADSYVKACNMLGRSKDVVAFADEFVPFYTRISETQNLPALKLGRVEALLNLNRLDEAAAALSDPELPGSPIHDIELRRLQKRLRELRASIFLNRSARPAEAGPPADTLIANAVAGLNDLSGGLPEEASLKRVIETLASVPTATASNLAAYRQNLDALREAETFMQRGSSGDSLLSVRGRIREATALFVEQEHPPAEAIRTSLAGLEQDLAWSEQHGVVELQNDALYGIYLSHNRLNEFSAAADALLKLRGNLEATRSAITDVTQRGGAFAAYPYLFNALCEKLHQAGRTPEMLEAIEASKGRAVADLLTGRSGAAVTDSSIYGAVAHLPALCREHAFHYVTFFVDDERTYPVLVTSSANLIAPPPVRLSRADIRGAAGELTADAFARLSPLVDWLEAFIDAGAIRAGDHICISPDDDLANVPFACLPLGGRPLAEVFSSSRTHNAFHLAHVLEGRRLRPDAHVGIVVPSRQNVAHPQWTIMHDNLCRPIAKVAEYLPGTTLEGEAVSIDLVSRCDLTRRVVHFSTHGIFPRRDPDKGPFEYSGLLLADRGSLPDVTAVNLLATLTPRAVLDKKMDLTDSHVSMMACVSGLSREGIGGDALGMEWAMIQAGASSIVSTHWDVSAKLVAAYLEKFYEHWLGRGESRARAMSATISSLRAVGGRAADIASWGAFSLTGDWR